MSDQEPNFELDDELLSAYLDGELTAAERAAVEARLAADPSAQQLLHELRSVSQAVQGLPPKTVGRDLTDEIVRRARDAKPAPTEAPSTLLGDTMPKVTIFGSPRAWIWASLALAAGLLIMFLQSDNRQANNLPQVAQHTERKLTEQPAGEVAAPSMRAPSAQSESEANRRETISADDLAKLKVEAPVAKAPAQSIDQMHESLRSSPPTNAPIASTSPAPTNDRDKLGAATGARVTGALSSRGSDKRAMPPEAAGRPTALGGALSTAPGSGEPESAESQNQFVVVHVVAKREAIQNKSFDRLLASHGIDLEPQSLKDQSHTISGRAFRKQAPELAIKLDDKSAAGQGTDFVLVEAPKPTILSCLASLHKDSANFVGIEVDDSSNAHDYAYEKSGPVKNLADGFSKYARGVVPPQQKASADRYSPYYYGSKAAAASPAGAAGAATTRAAGTNALGAGQQAVSDSTTFDRNRATTENLGGARRGRSSDGKVLDEERQRSAGTSDLQSGVETKKLPMSLRALKEPAKSQTDELRVLFVLSPESTLAPSAPPDNRTK